MGGWSARKFGALSREELSATLRVMQNIHKGFIPPHGGHAKLVSYPKIQIICDATARFCDRFIMPPLCLRKPPP